MYVQFKMQREKVNIAKFKLKKKKRKKTEFDQINRILSFVICILISHKMLYIYRFSILKNITIIYIFKR